MCQNQNFEIVGGRYDGMQLAMRLPEDAVTISIDADELENSLTSPSKAELPFLKGRSLRYMIHGSKLILLGN